MKSNVLKLGLWKFGALVFLLAQSHISRSGSWTQGSTGSYDTTTYYEESATPPVDPYWSYDFAGYFDGSVTSTEVKVEASAVAQMYGHASVDADIGKTKVANGGANSTWTWTGGGSSSSVVVSLVIDYSGLLYAQGAVRVRYATNAVAIAWATASAQGTAFSPGASNTGQALADLYAESLGDGGNGGFASIFPDFGTNNATLDGEDTYVGDDYGGEQGGWASTDYFVFIETGYTTSPGLTSIYASVLMNTVTSIDLQTETPVETYGAAETAAYADAGSVGVTKVTLGF